MKYELINTGYSVERIISDTEYEITITLGFKPLVDLFLPNFSIDIIVISNNNQTGFEVDNQRQLAITNKINEINGI